MANKLAVVTGASTGIGKEIAKLAAKDGYDLIVVADEPGIDASADAFRSGGGTVEAVEADLATFEGNDRLLAAMASGASTCSPPMPGAGLAMPLSTRTPPTGAG